MQINHACAEHFGGKTYSSHRALEDPKARKSSTEGQCLSHFVALCGIEPAYNDIPQKVAFRSALLRERQMVARCV
jgi:hypothetical protein